MKELKWIKNLAEFQSFLDERFAHITDKRHDYKYVTAEYNSLCNNVEVDFWTGPAEIIKLDGEDIWVSEGCNNYGPENYGFIESDEIRFGFDIDWKECIFEVMYVAEG